MKSYKLPIQYLLFISILLSFSSCKSFLSEYSGDLAYIKTVDDLDQLLIGSGYMEVNPRTPIDYNKFYFPFLHFISDETQEVIGETRYSPDATIRPHIFGYYTWQKNVGSSFDGMTRKDESVDWLRIYNHISTLNVILSEADEIVPQTETEKEKWNRVIAETYFLRGAYHFWLVNIYADPYCKANSSKPGIPLKLEQNIIDKKYERATLQSVYDIILEDLSKAESLMPKETGTSKYRISKGGIYLLKSRVYLYMQNWEKSAEYAKKCISHGGALQNLNGWSKDDFFLTLENNEVLFSMGGSLVYSRLDDTAPTGNFEVSEELYNLFSDDDHRKVIYFKKDKSKFSYKGTFVNPIKQDPRGPYRAEISENYCLRLSEAYLNLAEANAYMNKSDASKKAIRQLMQMRYKPSAVPALDGLSQAELVSFIRDERRKELCFEGHRWFDLRRYRVTEQFPYKKDLRNSYTIYVKENRNSRPHATYEYLLPADEDFGYTFPIPFEEKLINDIIQDNERVEREPINIIYYE